MKTTGRPDEHVGLIEAYYRESGLMDSKNTRHYSQIVELDMARVVPSLAGPRRPQDRIGLDEMKERFMESARLPLDKGGFGLPGEAVESAADRSRLQHGSVVIAAITSCTNTSNPYVMIGAGLVAKKAVEAGLVKAPYVKTSLTPGSKVVTDYLEKAGLLEHLEQLGFHVAGYGCATCIGNSGPLPESIESEIVSKDLVAASVLSGNRNFEGRIHPHVKANYLASPMLVVAYAIAGSVNLDPYNEPLAYTDGMTPVFLKDIWPSSAEIKEAVDKAMDSKAFKEKYADIFMGNERFNAIPVAKSRVYPWDESSSYIKSPPFFTGLKQRGRKIEDIMDTKVIAYLGDSVTTDHISPAGYIGSDSAAGEYLKEQGVEPMHFNSYGSRRGNHEVMMRGTFANTRIRNKLLSGVEGGYSIHQPTGETGTILMCRADIWRKVHHWLFWRAKNTVQEAQGTGRQRGRTCWESKQSLQRAMNASTVPILLGWVFCRCSFWRVRIRRVWG